jgi:hypothetical protein
VVVNEDGGGGELRFAHRNRESVTPWFLSVTRLGFPSRIVADPRLFFIEMRPAVTVNFVVQRSIRGGLPPEVHPTTLDEARASPI